MTGKNELTLGSEKRKQIQQVRKHSKTWWSS